MECNFIIKTKPSLKRCGKSAIHHTFVIGKKSKDPLFLCRTHYNYLFGTLVKK